MPVAYGPSMPIGRTIAMDAAPPMTRKAGNDQNYASTMADIVILARKMPEDALHELVRRLHELPARLAERRKVAQDDPPVTVSRSDEELGVVADRFPDFDRLGRHSDHIVSGYSEKDVRNATIEAAKFEARLGRHSDRRDGNAFTERFPDAGRLT